MIHTAWEFIQWPLALMAFLAAALVTTFAVQTFRARRDEARVRARETREGNPARSVEILEHELSWAHRLYENLVQANELKIRELEEKTQARERELLRQVDQFCEKTKAQLYEIRESCGDATSVVSSPDPQVALELVRILKGAAQEPAVVVSGGRLPPEVVARLQASLYGASAEPVVEECKSHQHAVHTQSWGGVIRPPLGPVDSLTMTARITAEAIEELGDIHRTLREIAVCGPYERGPIQALVNRLWLLLHG